MVRKFKHQVTGSLILFSIFFMGSQTATSQILIALLFGDKLNNGKMEFGLTGGWSYSHITDLNESKSKSGLNLGLFFNIKLNEKWYIHPEAIPKFPTGVKKLPPYSLGDETLDSLFTGGSVTRKIKNIALPILVRYRIWNELFVEGGPQINLRTKAKDIFEKGNLSYENKIGDDVTRFDFGLAFGLAQRLGKGMGKVAIGARYYMGLTDILKTVPGNQKNGVFQLSANIPIGVGKHQETPEKKNGE